MAAVAKLLDELYMLCGTAYGNEFHCIYEIMIAGNDTFNELTWLIVRAQRKQSNVIRGRMGCS